MSSLIAGYAVTITGVVLFMVVAFLLAQKKNRYDLADVAWGLAFIVAALVSYLWQFEVLRFVDVSTALTLLVVVWGVRLSRHIASRFISKTEEDDRYQELRRGWKGRVWLNALLRVFVLQALLAVIIVSPVVYVNLLQGPVQLNGFAYIGLLLWLASFVFEAVADRQLKYFVVNPANKEKLMTSGLWRYSRHPNYFGEVMQWWAIWFVVASTTLVGWVTVIGPAVVMYLILRVSGVPLLEKKYQERKDWQEYTARTSKFIPLPPRS